MPLPVVAPMLATNRPTLTLDDRWAVEPKLDGWRALIYVGDNLRVRTRRGRDITASVPELAGIAEAIAPGTILDGELVAGQGRPKDFYRLGPHLAARRGPARVCFSAFDILAVNGDLVVDRTYEQRRALLTELGFEGPAWCTTASFSDAPVDAMAACVEHGLEGVVVKRLDSTYRPGRRSNLWVKVKTSDWRAAHAGLRHER